MKMKKSWALYPLVNIYTKTWFFPLVNIYTKTGFFPEKKLIGEMIIWLLIWDFSNYKNILEKNKKSFKITLKSLSKVFDTLNHSLLIAIDIASEIEADILEEKVVNIFKKLGYNIPSNHMNLATE